MKRAIEKTSRNFETSSTRTPQYLEWHRIFKAEFTKFLQARGFTNIQIGSPNHFDMSGFFTARNGQAWYFRVEDVRWSKDSMLIRTARNYTDYTGGINKYATLKNDDAFSRDFASATSVSLEVL